MYLYYVKSGIFSVLAMKLENLNAANTNIFSTSRNYSRPFSSVVQKIASVTFK